ncbi:MAG: lysostaphin resistance A-like protein, partial [Ktedonobacterales bacterium]
MRSLDQNLPDEHPGSLASGAPATRWVSATPWTLRQMVIGAAATLIPWLAFSLSAAALAGGSSTAAAKPPSVALDALGGVVAFILSALLEAIFLVAPIVVVFNHRLPPATFGERMRWLGFRATPLLPALGVIAIALVIGLGGSVLYSQLITAFHLPLQTNSETLLKQGQAAPLTTIGLLAAAALVAPVCEEVFFRSFVFVGLLKRLPLWPSVILSAVIFGVAHADLGSLAPLVLIGRALAWARWRSDSVWPGIVVHAINNTAAAAVLL